MYQGLFNYLPTNLARYIWIKLIILSYKITFSQQILPSWILIGLKALTCNTYVFISQASEISLFQIRNCLIKANKWIKHCVNCMDNLDGVDYMDDVWIYKKILLCFVELTSVVSYFYVLITYNQPPNIQEWNAY